MKAFIYLIIISVLISCNGNHQNIVEQREPEKQSVPRSELDQSIAVQSKGESIIVLQGMVDVPPNQRVSIKPYFEGYVTDIRVLDGSQVKKGDLLFRLTHPSFIKIQRDYLTHLAEVNYLQKDLERKKKLNDERITADLVYQETEMKYKIAQANLASVKKMIVLMNLPFEQIEADNLFDKISIYAPIDGFVDQLSVNAGEYIDGHSLVATIVNTDHAHLELKVFEKDLSHINAGQKIDFRIPEVSHKTFRGEIHLIGKTIDPKTRQINVHAHVINQPPELLPGMFVEASLTSE
jgi:cobalt-zinc-cadmium efflux system membrane fusion protein